MLFYPDRISPYLLLIPVIAAVQFVFTLACAYLVAAGNVFFRDLGNVETHVDAAVVVPVAGPVQPRPARRAEHLPGEPVAADPRRTQPVRDPVRGVSEGHLRLATPEGPPGLPDFGSLAALLVASFILLAFTTIVFKRLEPNFAKVI